MDWKHTTGKTIQESFEEFHSKNPLVYGYFKEFAFEALKKGKKKISFKMIMNVIRWEIYINTHESEDVQEPFRFKISDAYHSRYARLFVSDFPQYASFVELRSLRSE